MTDPTERESEERVKKIRARLGFTPSYMMGRHARDCEYLLAKLDEAREQRDLVERILDEALAQLEAAKGRVVNLEEDVLVLKLAWGDCYDAMDWAAAEGFEWPKDPVTVNVKEATERFAVLVTSPEPGTKE